MLKPIMSIHQLREKLFHDEKGGDRRIGSSPASQKTGEVIAFNK